MVNVRDINGEDAFLHVLFRKAFGYFASLAVFHYYNYVCPAKLFFRKWLCVVKSCGFCFKSVSEYFFCCFASVLVLVADKQEFHSNLQYSFLNLNLAIYKRVVK